MHPETKNSASVSRATDSVANHSESFLFWGNYLLPGAALFLFTVLVYWPSFGAGLIWDDDLMVGNSLVRGGWPGLRDIWTTTKVPDFCPLTVSSFWLEQQLGVGTTAIRHATNIFLQALNVVLLWQVLRALKIRGAWIAALIFAAHPLSVTSVTWIAERKNTLSMFFYLLSLLLFLRTTDANDPLKERNQSSIGENDSVSDDRNSEWGKVFWLSFIFYLFALLSKTSAVVLPIVLLLVTWWRGGRISRIDLKSVLPFFGVAFAAGLTTVIAHYFFGPKDSLTDSLLVRLLGGARAVWFYSGKAIAPLSLTMNYPRWEIDSGAVISYLPVLAILVVCVVLWKFRERWGRSGFFCFAYFLVALAPTLGIFKMTFLKFSQVADHFQFLALPGLIAFLVGGSFYLVEKAPQFFQKLVPILCCLLAMRLVFSTWHHQQIIGNAETLWRDNVEKNPKSWLAQNGLANALQAKGSFAEAEIYYRNALELRPDYLDALSNYGVLLGRSGRLPEAIECYRRAIAFNPNVAAIHFNLGSAFYSQNRFAEAVGSLARAVELAPMNSNYQNNLGSALTQMHEEEKALPHLLQAVQLDPLNAEAQSNLGLVYFRQSKIQEALDQYQKAMVLAEAAGQKDMAMKFREFLERYRRRP